MWIRSQNKKQLVEASDLYISTRGKGYSISTGKGNDLGTYSSEEKALKVLDIIQIQIINHGEVLTEYFPLTKDSLYNKITHKGFITFQMPQDSEVE